MPPALAPPSYQVDPETGRAPRVPYTRISTSELAKILALLDQSVSHREISRITGICQPRISEIAQETDEARRVGKHTLYANQAHAAEQWIETFPQAVKRGDHRPMKDLLIATGLIAPDPQAQGVTIVIGANASVELPNALKLPDLEAKVLTEPTITDGAPADIPGNS